MSQAQAREENPSPAIVKRALQIAVGIAIAALLVWLLFRGVSWAELYASLREIHPGWFLAAQVPIWASFWVRILRWKYVVRAVHPSTFRAMFSATQLAFLVNFTIGLRLGELVRPLALSRLSRMPFTKALAVNTLDRINDLIGLLAVMLVAVMGFRPKEDIVLPPGTFGVDHPPAIPASIVVTGGQAAAAGLVVLIAILVLLYVNQRLALWITRALAGLISTRLANWACHLLQQFAEGLHIFRSAGDMSKSIAFNLLTWACFLLSYVCFFEAFAIDWPWYSPLVVQCMLAFFVSAPGVPGMIGQFHLPIVGGMLMSIPGVALSDAVAVALVAHAANMLPILLLGLYCMYREGLSMRELSE
jgi:hypothetical protein